MDKLQALNNFWNSFDIPAYDQYTVPDEAKPPYITYEASVGDLNHPVFVTASLWYYGKSWTDIEAKEKQIFERISGGTNIPYDGGAFWLVEGSPKSQRMGDSNDMIRRKVLNFTIEFFD